MDSAPAIRCAGPAAHTDVLRDVAHELRQPLSTIESIAYYLAMVLPPADERARAQLNCIRQLVEQSNWILSSGLGLVGCAPAGAPVPIDLEELLTRAAAASVGQDRPTVRFALAGSLPLVQLDPGQGRDLAETLLILARQLAARGPVTISSEACCSGGAALLVSAPAQVSMSAFGPGAMLGLENARKIAEIHGGRLTLESSPEAGIRLTVMLP